MFLEKMFSSNKILLNYAKEKKIRKREKKKVIIHKPILSHNLADKDHERFGFELDLPTKDSFVWLALYVVLAYKRGFQFDQNQKKEEEKGQKWSIWVYLMHYLSH